MQIKTLCVLGGLLSLGIFSQSTTAQPIPGEGGTNTGSGTVITGNTNRNLVKYNGQVFYYINTNSLPSDNPELYNALLTIPSTTETTPSIKTSRYADSILLRLSGFDYSSETHDLALIISDNVAGSTWKVEFQYDGKMRRRVMKEYNLNGTVTNEVHYVYDGNVVVEERDWNNTLRVGYVRGKDLSGQTGSALNGAGGIGGLLARVDYTTGTAVPAYYHSDANGNVTCLTDGSQNVVARYAYDPYGNLLAKSGSLADVNAYRFSSKEWNENSGLVYYLYRFYDPNLQRWLNRDPIGEGGFWSPFIADWVAFTPNLMRFGGADSLRPRKPGWTALECVKRGL